MSSNPAITVGITAVDKASQTLDAFDKNVQKTTGVVTTSSDKIDQKTAQTATKFKASLATMALSAATLTAGIVAFATSFDTLEKAQLAADKQQLALARSIEALNDKRKSGKATANELAIAEELVRQNTEKARLAQDSLKDTYSNFLAQIPLQLLSFGTSAVMMYNAITASELSAAAASGVLHKAFTFLQTHPIIFAISGIATLILLVTSNTFGLRDAIWGLGKTMLAFLDLHFKPLSDAIRWFIDGITWLIGGLNNQVPPAFATAGAAATGFGTAAGGAITSVMQLVDKSTLSINAMTEAFKRGQKVVDASKLVTAGGSIRGAFGGSSEDFLRQAKASSVGSQFKGGSLKFGAQGGLHTILPDDATIFAHRGERVDITPQGRNTGNGEIIVNIYTRDPGTTVDVNNRRLRAVKRSINT